MAETVDLARARVRVVVATDALDSGLKAAAKKARQGGKKAGEELADGVKGEKRRARKAGEDLGEQLKDGVASHMPAMIKVVKGAVAAFLGFQVVQYAMRGIQAGIQYLRGAAAAAEEWTKSYMRLSAAATLFGVDQRALNALSAEAQSKYRMSAGAANELAIQVTKLAAKAGDASRAQELLARALDLGAAQGYDAAQVAVALEQTLRGLDEGTDKLFQKNPSQIYEEYARSIGTTGAALTDVQQKQALVNATITEGAKVQGAYGEMIRSDVGGMISWRTQLQQAREEVGQYLLPVLVDLTERLSGPLSTAIKAVTGLLERFMDPADRLLLKLREIGAQSTTLAKIQLRTAIEQMREERTELDRALQRTFEDPSARGFAPGSTRLAETRLISRAEAQTRIAAAQAEIDKLADSASRRDEQTLRNRTAEVLALSEIVAAWDALEQKQNEIVAAERELKDLREGAPAPPKPTETTPTTPALTPEQVKARQQALKDVQQLQAQLTRSMAALTVTATDEALLALNDMEAEIRAKYATLGQEIPADVLAQLDRLREDIRRTGAAEAHELELERLAALGPTNEAQEALRAYVDTLYDEREALEDGSTARQRWTGLLKRAQDQIKANTEAQQQAADAAIQQQEQEREAQRQADEERRRNLRDQARVIEDSARAALRLAEAFGMVDERAARSMESVITLASAIPSLLAGDMSALPAALGGVAGLMGGLFGESRSAAERRAALEANTRAIEKLALEMAGFRATMENITGARRAIEGFDILPGTHPMIRERLMEELERRLVSFGSSMEELSALAEKYGIDIFDDKGRIIAGSLEQLALQLSLAEQALVGFRDTVDDQRAMMELEADVYDRATTSADKLAMQLELLQRFSPELYGQFFGGLDPSTAEGREAIEAAMRALFEAFRSGDLDLGNMTRDEFLRIFGDIEGALDELGEGGVVIDPANQKNTIIGGITEQHANLLLRYSATMVDHLAAIRRHFDGGAVPAALMINTPSTAAMTPGAQTIVVDLGGVDITIEAAGSDPASLEQGGRRAGRAFGDAFSESLHAAWRGAGTVGSARVGVRAKGATE